jgi:hypothetical protein
MPAAISYLTLTSSLTRRSCFSFQMSQKTSQIFEHGFSLTFSESFWRKILHFVQDDGAILIMLSPSNRLKTNSAKHLAFYLSLINDRAVTSTARAAALRR